MPQPLKDLFSRIKGFWDAFSIPQKTFAIIAVAALVLGGFVTYQAISRPPMTALYSGLSPTDAQAVVDALTAENVDYELANGGGTVLVPRDKLYDLRVQLAGQGIPSQQDGYSLFDDMGVASSDFQQQITYQRALEGELASTIQAMDGVSLATVRLALPEQTVFTDEVDDPTASVFIQTNVGTSLESKSVQAIQTLVAAGVPGLQPADVTIVDSSGLDLTLNAAGVNGVNTEYEQQTAQRVQSMLDQVLGAGNAVVSVSAEMSTESIERLSETFDAGENVPPLSSHTEREEYTGVPNNAAGVLGPDNIAVPNDPQNAGTYQRETETVNNSVNKVTESTIAGPGGLNRQSVSVVVDQTSARAFTNEQIREVVSAAAGIVEDRGDTLAVTRTVFDRTAADEAQEALAAAQAQADADAEEARAMALLRLFVIVGIAAVLLVAGLIISARRRAAKRRAEAAELAEQMAFLEMPPAETPEEELEDFTEAPTKISEPVIDPDEQVRTELVALVDEEPEAVAERLRDWLVVRK